MTRQQYKKITDDFRIYYNQAIFPTLLRLERQRKGLSLIFILAILGTLSIGYLALTAQIPTLMLLLWVPLSSLGAIGYYQIERFRSKFKPRIVNLILDFIDKKLEQGTTRRQQEIEQRIQAYELEVTILEGKVSETKQRLYYKIEQRLDNIGRQLETGTEANEINEARIRAGKLTAEVKDIKVKIINAKRNPDRNSGQRIQEMEEQLIKVEKQIKGLNLTLTEGLEAQIIAMDNQINILKKRIKHLHSRMGESLEATLEYSFERKINIETFLASQIFYITPYAYTGEDYIQGVVGSATFEMSELEVLKLSRVRSRYDTIFRGIFFKANFYYDSGELVVFYPKEEKQFLSNTIKHLTSKGYKRISLSIPELDQAFMAYATTNVRIDSLISKGVLKSITDYKKRSGKKIYVSFVDGFMYMAISETKDILEPKILSSNANFKLINEFFEDLLLIISVVEDFDLNH